MSTRGVSRLVVVALTSVATISFVGGATGEARAQEAGEPGAQPGPEGYDPGAPPQQLDAPYPAQAPEGAPPQADGSDYAPQDDPNAGAPLIPPNVEGPAYPASDGNYCYVGPHPVDTRVVPGDSWDNTQGQHSAPMRPSTPVCSRFATVATTSPAIRATSATADRPTRITALIRSRRATEAAGAS